MVATNFQVSLDFVWRPEFDSPLQPYHVEPGDPGLGTKGGVIEATWTDAVKAGIVRGSLANATNQQLSAVLRWKCWGSLCDSLPTGLDLLILNGRMMSGHYLYLVQQCLGYIGPEVDGKLGPISLAKIRTREPETLVDALTGTHAAYLAGLGTFKKFGAGWTNRIRQARTAAMALIDAEPGV